jgi:cytochrome c553
MKTILIALAGMLSVSPAVLSAQELAPARAPDLDPSTRTAAERLAVHTCAICHGVQGHSVSPKFPVLAGQQADYTMAQLRAFKLQTRSDPDALGFMWGMASQLDDGLIAGLADYYSRQSPAAGPAEDRSEMARGRDLYLNGDAARGIPACAACHGAAGAGTAQFPRLAGQHAQYLVKQLRSYQDNLRTADTMRTAIRGLTGSEMQAVAVFLQSLGPDHPINTASAQRTAM